MNDKRRKAFIGALINTGVNVVGGLINKNKQKRQMRQQQMEANIEAGNQQAQAMTAAYADQDYVDQYYDKITLKNGGKVKYSDRITRDKKFKCGGRNKASLGVKDAVTKEVSNGISNMKSGYTDRLTLAKMGTKKR